MVERSDFPGLLLGMLIWYIFIQQSGINMLDYVRKFTIAIFSSAGYDFFWLIAHYDGYWDDELVDKTIKEFTYAFAFLNFLVKVCLGVSLYINFTKEKRKRKTQFESSSKKNIFSRNSVDRLGNSNSNSNYQGDKARKSVAGFFQGKNPFSLTSLKN